MFVSTLALGMLAYKNVERRTALLGLTLPHDTGTHLNSEKTIDAELEKFSK